MDMAGMRGGEALSASLILGLLANKRGSTCANIQYTHIFGLGLVSGLGCCARLAAQPGIFRDKFRPR